MASVPNITSEFTVEEVTMPTDSPVDLSAEFAELENMEVMNEGIVSHITYFDQGVKCAQHGKIYFFL
jgi:hypothetical protein